MKRIHYLVLEKGVKKPYIPDYFYKIDEESDYCFCSNTNTKKFPEEKILGLAYGRKMIIQLEKSTDFKEDETIMFFPDKHQLFVIGDGPEDSEIFDLPKLRKKLMCKPLSLL